VVSAHERQGGHQSTRLSLAQGWRLVRTPSSENGIYEYYRALLDRPPEPEGLLTRMRSLRVGTSMRFEVLAAIANSDEARRRGVRGPGLRLINLAAFVARRSGLARRAKRRRFNRALVALVERGGVGEASSSTSSPDHAELLDRIDRMLQERLPRTEASEELIELADRVASVEDALLELLNGRARELRDPARSVSSAG
jgi:hypothetical protein